MLKKCSFVLLVAVLSVGLISCEKIPSNVPGQTLATVNFLDAVPVEYGTLVAVTSHPDSDAWFALWFEKPDKTITTVWVNVAQGRVGKAATIPRK